MEISFDDGETSMAGDMDDAMASAVSKTVVLTDDTTDEEEEEEKKKKSHKKKDEDDEETKAAEKEEKEKRVKKRANCPIFVSKRKIIQKVQYEHLVLHEFENIDVNEAPIVEGFPTEGVTSIMTAQYFIEELKLPLIGQIVPEGITRVCIIKDNQPSTTCRIYGNKKMVVFMCEQKLDTDLINDTVQAIFDFAKRHRASHIITLEGVTKDITVKDGTSPEEILKKLKASAESTELCPLRFLTNEEKVGKFLKDEGCKQIRGGAISGVTGGILCRAHTADVTITGLLCQHNPMQSDARSSIQLVKVLDKLLGASVEVDTKPLERKAKILEKQIKKAIGTAADTTAMKHPSMYM